MVFSVLSVTKRRLVPPLGDCHTAGVSSSPCPFGGTWVSYVSGTTASATEHSPMVLQRRRTWAEKLMGVLHAAAEAPKSLGSEDFPIAGFCGERRQIPWGAA